MTDLVTGRLDGPSREFVAAAGLSSRLKDIARWIASRDIYDLASWIALLSLIVIALATFDDYAISNDEGVQHHYGELIIAYYKSGFTDQSLFKLDNLYLYGGLFDVSLILLGYILPFDQNELRHLVCDRNLDGKAIAKIERMGVTIGVVKDRRAIRTPGRPAE